MTQSSEVTELVAAARDGSRTAFDELVRVTYADTYTLAYRLTGNEEDARDVVQEAYLRAYRGLRQFRGDAQFSTWLYRITANCASTHLGRAGRHRHDELDDDVAGDRRPDPSPIPQARADAAAPASQLEAALAELPPRLRAVVVLRDVYDLPHEAIAAELGISESAAKVRLHRARRSCASGCSRPRVTRRSRACSVTTLAELLAEAAEGHPVPDRAARRHVEHCLRCQAELVQYRRLPPGACASLADRRVARARTGLRSTRSWPRSTRRPVGRRPALPAAGRRTSAGSRRPRPRAPASVLVLAHPIAAPPLAG